ncbi:MAG: hypothetical protein ABSB82_19415 [Terriglobia bacterium]|jgi:hypothetical protein
MKKLNFSRRKYWASVLVLGGVVLVLAMLGTSPTRTRAQEQEGVNGDKDAQVIDTNSVAYGKTFSEWSAQWNQWADSIPVAQHPLFDNGDCSVGQSGPVWFLGGKFCGGGNCISYTVVRTCNLPSGKALYFPVIDYEDSALEQSVNEHPGVEAYQQIGTLRSVTSGIEGASGLSCEIDHKPIPHFPERFSVQSTAFGFTLPTDNLFAAMYPPPNNNFEAGTYFPGVDDGYYVMLAPLPPGNHTLHFTAGTWLDITYHLNVARESEPSVPPAATVLKRR